MIDLHCHLLPEVDDGPGDLAAALELARAQVASGVHTVTVTPHVTWDLPGNDAPFIAERVTALRQELEDARIVLDVRTGAEIALTRAVDLTDDELHAMSIGGDSPWLLVESPLAPSATGFEQVLHHLHLRGHRLVLAHPERCPAFQRDPELLGRCVAAGMLTSVTAGAFAGRFGQTVRRFAFSLASEGLVHNVASDAHDAHRRPPGLRAELEEAGLASHAAWWTEEVPAALIAGGPIPPGPPAPVVPAASTGSRRGLLGRLRGS